MQVSLSAWGVVLIAIPAIHASAWQAQPVVHSSHRCMMHTQGEQNTAQCLFVPAVKITADENDVLRLCSMQ